MAEKDLNDPWVVRPELHIHIVGIAGAGMSAIAHVLLGQGVTVSGSDMQANAQTVSLTAAGATVYQGHAAAQIEGADWVVVSSAIPAGNPELQAARLAGIPVLKRADLLGHMMTDYRGIAVAGTHGKTSTTGMLAQIFMATGQDPTVIVGGELPGLVGHGRAGDGRHFIVEADEYDHMFLGLRPLVAVVTNMEHDHPDIYPTEADYLDAFAQFVALLPADGLFVGCSDDPHTHQMLVQALAAGVPVMAYGFEAEKLPAGADHLLATDFQPNQAGGSDFVVSLNGDTLGLVRLRLAGRHNVLNALAALAVGLHEEIPFPECGQALASFGGVNRRLQHIGTAADVVIVDDYGHHPTEIRVILAALRQQYGERKLWAVWQPHTYSRTKLLQHEFIAAFEAADEVIVLDIYRSRETDTLGIDSAQVVAQMSHPAAHYIGAREAAAAYLLDHIQPGDLLVTFGAGDGNAVGQWVLDGLKANLNRRQVS